MSTIHPRVLTDVGVPMRDGVRLSADIYPPSPSGPAPGVLCRTPYDSSAEEYVAIGTRSAEAGFVGVIQDSRGRGDSDGSFRPFVDEAKDGADTPTWIAAQPWCNGKIGMTGSSYDSWTQWTEAMAEPDLLTCMVPQVMTTDAYSHFFYPGGAFGLAALVTWMQTIHGRSRQNITPVQYQAAIDCLPLSESSRQGGHDSSRWRQWLSNPDDGEHWATYRQEEWASLRAPSLAIGGWFDFFGADTFRSFNAMRMEAPPFVAENSRLVVGPWIHPAPGVGPIVGEVNFGPEAEFDLAGLELLWFRRWLKHRDGDGGEDAPIRIFVMGANQWRDEHEWPLARTNWQHWYLHSSGNANTADGDGTLSPSSPTDEPVDTFIYDPLRPAPSCGGGIFLVT